MARKALKKPLIALGACLVASLLLPPSIARAQCVPGGISAGASARLDASVLPLLEPLVREQVPTRFAVPDSPYTVFTCGGGFFDDTIVTPDGVVARVSVRTLRLRFVQGALVLDATLDLKVDGDLHLQMCAAPDADCAITVDAPAATLHARIEPTVTRCTPKMPISEFLVEVDPEATQITFAECLYDGLWNTVYDWFRDYIVETLSEKIADAVKEKLPPLLEAFTTGMIADGFEYRKVHVSVAPSDVSVSPSGAVITFDGDVRPIGEPPPGWCLGKNAQLPEEPDAPVGDPSGDAMVSLAMSQPMLSRAVRATWLAGGLCYASTEFDLDLATPIDFLAPGVDVTGRLAVLDAPSVDLADGRVDVKVDTLNADVFLQVPGHEATRLSATMGATLAGTVAIDPRLQSVVLDLSEAHTTGAVVTAPGTELSFSGATLERLVNTSLLPTLARYRGRMALLGNLFTGAPVAARVDRVDVETTRVQADLELYPKDPNDHTPPVAALDHEPASPSPSRFTFDVASTDDRTPVRFLRHRLVIDGTEDPELRSGTRIVVSGLTDGLHEVYAYALDLNDNESPEPAAFAVEVDSVAPVVNVLDAPRGVLRGADVTLRVDAHDAVSPDRALSLWYVLSKVCRDNTPDDVVSEGPLFPGAPLVLKDLPEDVVLRVRVKAVDEAGNEGFGEASFYRNDHPTLGACTTAGPAGLLVLAGLALLRRRRRAGSAA